MPQRVKRREPKVPETMRAAAIDKFGPPSVIKLHELPVPRPGAGEVLIALRGAEVGEWDESIRDGSWKVRKRAKYPMVLGTDGAGVVVAKGKHVRRYRVGDRVWGYMPGNPKGGFYSEYIAINEKKTGHVPDRLELLQAGAGAVTALTALQGIDDTLHVRKGETVLVFGASGAVGTLAVQFAKRHGARVIGTASGKRARTLVRRLGAVAVIDARSDAAIEQLRDLAPDGIDAVLALAGGDELERCLDFVREGGRVAHPNGIEPEPKRRRKFRIDAYDAEPGPREFARLARAVDEARLRVPIDAVYPLARAADAHRRLNKKVLGRIALRI
jgi:NADPH:quinone reductase-like Zn-dependent oxidoreductase